MANIDYNKALNEWAADHLNLKDGEEVTSVEITTIYGGYCETCEYTEAGVVARVKGATSYKERQLYVEPADLVREVSEYIQKNLSLTA